MESLKDLFDQKVALESKIASRKAEAVTAIKQLMVASGVTLDDLGGSRDGARRLVAQQRQRALSGAKRPVKYRDGENTWTGVGQRPRWLVKALSNGATLEQFASKG